MRDGNIARALTEQAHKHFAALPAKGITITDFLPPFAAAIATRDIDIKSDAVTRGFTSVQKARIPCCSDCEGQTGHQTAMQVYNSIVGSRMAFDEKGNGLDDETIVQRILHALHTGELLTYPRDQKTVLAESVQDRLPTPFLARLIKEEAEHEAFRMYLRRGIQPVPVDRKKLAQVRRVDRVAPRLLAARCGKRLATKFETARNAFMMERIQREAAYE